MGFSKSKISLRKKTLISFKIKMQALFKIRYLCSKKNSKTSLEFTTVYCPHECGKISQQEQGSEGQQHGLVDESWFSGIADRLWLSWRHLFRGHPKQMTKRLASEKNEHQGVKGCEEHQIFCGGAELEPEDVQIQQRGCRGWRRLRLKRVDTTDQRVIN